MIELGDNDDDVKDNKVWCKGCQREDFPVVHNKQKSPTTHCISSRMMMVMMVMVMMVMMVTGKDKNKMQ